MKPQPWSQADATDEIRKVGGDPSLTLAWTMHAKERMADRDLLIGDALYVLRKGFVLQRAEPCRSPSGLFRYQIESRTPNSANRVVRLVVIPDPVRKWIKIVTVMWADEPGQGTSL